MKNVYIINFDRLIADPNVSIFCFIYFILLIKNMLFYQFELEFLKAGKRNLKEEANTERRLKNRKMKIFSIRVVINH